LLLRLRKPVSSRPPSPAIRSTALRSVARSPTATGRFKPFYITECHDIDSATRWANKLPTHGYVEVRELLQN